MAKYQFIENPDVSVSLSEAGLSFTIYDEPTEYASFRVVSNLKRLRCVQPDGTVANIYVNNQWFKPDDTSTPVSEPATINIDLNTLTNEELKAWFIANTVPYDNKLSTPTNVTVDGAIVQWDKVSNATNYDVFVDNELYENVASSSSAIVNNIIKKGKYVFNDTFIQPTLIDTDIDVNFNFKCVYEGLEVTDYTGMHFVLGNGQYDSLSYKTSDNEFEAWSTTNGGWYVEFKTIIIEADQTVTGNTDEEVEAFVSWFESNAVSTSMEYNLSTNDKWVDLTSGTHQVTIIAKATGYTDSEPSEAVDFEKPFPDTRTAISNTNTSQITKIEIKDSTGVVVFTSTTGLKYFTHKPEVATYIIVPTFASGYRLGEITTTSTTDTLNVLANGTISWVTNDFNNSTITLKAEAIPVGATFTFDKSMIQRIDVYDSNDELRFGTDMSGTTFKNLVVNTTYTIKPTYVEHYTLKTATTTSTEDIVTPLASSGNVLWGCRVLGTSIINIEAQIIPTYTTITWDSNVTGVDIYDGSKLVFSETTKEKVFKHDFDNKVYTIKPMFNYGYQVNTVVSTSINDTFAINDDGSISWTAGWGSGTITITSRKIQSFTKKVPNGNYYWKDNVSPMDTSTYDEITFKSNGVTFNGLTVTSNWGVAVSIKYGDLVVATRENEYAPLVWVDDKYKIVIFENVELSTPLYQWAYLRSNLRFTSEVEIQLYQCTCENKRVDKTNYLKLLDTITGTMRDSISVTDMSVEIEYPIPTFNYVYIPLFNRYYFVDDISSVVYGVWSVALSVDVLMSYKDTIKTLEAFVDRSQSNYNLKVIDNKLPLEKTETVEVDTVQNQLFVDNFGTYVLQGLQVTVGKAEENT